MTTYSAPAEQAFEDWWADYQKDNVSIPDLVDYLTTKSIARDAWFASRARRRDRLRKERPQHG